MIRINLVPVELIEKEARQRKLILGITGVVIILSLLVLFLFVRLGVERTLITRQRVLEVNLKKCQEKVDEVKNLKSITAVLETKKNIIEGLMRERLCYPLFMEQVMKLIPNGVWFTSLSVLANQGIFKVTISCNAFDNFGIADFVSNLENSQQISNIELGSITSSGSGAGALEVLQFQLIFNYSIK